MGTRAILICGGKETRWNGHTGVPKQLVDIAGTPLLYRTVEQLRTRDVTDVTVISGFGFPWQAPPGVGHELLTREQLNPSGTDADKFLSSERYWSRNSRTLVVYGDVFFTREAMDQICGYDERDWKLFCRFGPDCEQGLPQGGECFAQSFYPEDQATHRGALLRIAALRLSGRLTQCGGWEHYRAMHGVPDEDVSRHVRLTKHVEINDLTDDFDFPETYDSFLTATRGMELPL